MYRLLINLELRHLNFEIAVCQFPHPWDMVAGQILAMRKDLCSNVPSPGTRKSKFVLISCSFHSFNGFWLIIKVELSTSILYDLD